MVGSKRDEKRMMDGPNRVNPMHVSHEGSRALYRVHSRSRINQSAHGIRAIP